MHSLAQRYVHKKSGRELPLYGSTLWVLWAAALLATVALELIPAPGISPTLFYLRLGLKTVCFFVLGFATPLAIWRFDSLGLGMLFAVGTTLLVEFGQHIVAGHSTSLVECITKVVLIFSGLALGLNCRYERRLRLGPVAFNLLDPHSHV